MMHIVDESTMGVHNLYRPLWIGQVRGKEGEGVRIIVLYFVF